jgi:antitoxin YefM
LISVACQSKLAKGNPVGDSQNQNVARVLYMKTVTLAEARQSFSSLISEVESFDEHVMITKNGKPTAVIISADEWEAIEDTAFWLKVPGIQDDIAEARGTTGISLDQFVAERSAEAEPQNVQAGV